MNKISNYDELILHKKKLETDLEHYKNVFNEELQAVKQKLEPISNVVSFFTPPKNPSQNNLLLQAGTNLGIELFVRQKLLSKAGWFTKLVVPFILKKVSSRALEKVQEIRK
ncbi:hypothetical protein [Chryseolinea sp. H1M3-3]|uniref:hypothetical protein n=1 Tax=Chryseolinea sp. H1M3-3 TaxID=3034144 RepID=UPI0023EDE96F|nr:hypothetical protein [Chryseolinea sp. H1M3-3]